jgi:hypothetical protein
MNGVFNIYCDESCHLLHDGQKSMVIGAVWSPVEKAREIAVRLREIKARHGLSPRFETKWTKVSKGRANFYIETVDYFFDDNHLHFRGVVIPDKDRLDHAAYGHDHDTWYYKMFFTLLEPLLDPEGRYRIYLDKKDTRSAAKVAMLHDVLCNNMYDFDRRIIERVQVVQSHEVEQLQLCDLLIGALSYTSRGLAKNVAKNALIERIRQRSGYQLTHTTLLKEAKFNILKWQAGEGANG